MKKKDLRVGMECTLRDSQVSIITNITDPYIHFDNGISNDMLDDDMKNTGNLGDIWDIVRVVQPEEVLFVREDEPEDVEELTVEQICKELGRDIKIIK